MPQRIIVDDSNSTDNGATIEQAPTPVWSSSHSECGQRVDDTDDSGERKDEEFNKSRLSERNCDEEEKEAEEGDSDSDDMPEFQDRLEYLDERYEHLHKHIKALKTRMHSLEAILKRDGGEVDEECDQAIRDILEEMKREKSILRDEAAVIRGELHQATYKEEGRLCMTGEKRRAEEEAIAREKWLAEREERLAREAIEKEIKRQERLKELELQEEEQRRRVEIDRQRAAAMDRLKNLHLYETAEATRSEPPPSITPPLTELVPMTILPQNGVLHSPKRSALCSLKSLFCHRSPKKSTKDCNGSSYHGNGHIVNGNGCVEMNGK